MEASLERLTTSEAAVVAGVSVPQIHRIIDERILPESLYSTDQMRTILLDACVLISFYFETAESLTAAARLRAIRNALVHSPSWDAWKDCSFEEHFVSVHFQDIWRGVDERLHGLWRAREAVVQDAEILGGTPIFKGTRVPVYDIAALVDTGTPTERILKSYPSLKEWQVELASIYARAVPPKGRPKRNSSETRTTKSTTKKRLRSSSNRG